MARHALINPDTNEVINVVIWDGSEWQPPKGHLVIKDDTVNIGDSWDPSSQKIIKKDRSHKS